MIFAESNDKSFTEFDEDAFQYKDPKLGILFETEQILEDSMLLLRFNCPDPSCDVACKNWSALKAHVKSSHHRYLWYRYPVSLLMIVLSAHNIKRFSHMSISSILPANSQPTLQLAIQSKTSPLLASQAIQNVNSATNHFTRSMNSLNITEKNTNDVTFATE